MDELLYNGELFSSYFTTYLQLKPFQRVDQDKSKKELAQAISSETKNQEQWIQDLFAKNMDPSRVPMSLLGASKEAGSQLFFHFTCWFLPFEGEIEAFTNFPQHTTSLDAHRPTSNRLEGLTSKSNKCHEDFSLRTQVLENGFAHFHLIFLPNLSLHPNSLLFSNLLQIQSGKCSLGLWIYVFHVRSQ